MAADEIAIFTPAIREITEAGSNWCVSFEDENDGAAWVQVTGDLVNLAYPFKEDPRVGFSGFGLEASGTDLVSWEPEKYATLKVRDREPVALARFVDQIFFRVLGRTPGFRITVSVFETGDA